MKIIKVNEGEKKIGLSIKAVRQDEVQRDLDSYRASAGSSSTTMGDALRAARSRQAEDSE
jgi:translation initiation factor 2 alpha subunit (eIF-2alpha)